MTEPTSESSTLIKTSSRPAHQKKVEEYETALHSAGDRKRGIIQMGNERSIPEVTKQARAMAARDLLVERSNAKRKKAEDESIKDPLTKTLLNRRGYEERLKLEVARSKREGTPLVLFLADVRGLGALNNTYSMDAGDNLLKATARDLESETREGDAIARWGGDEFGILFPNTNLEEAEAVCKRIVAALARVHRLEFKYQGEDQLLEQPIGFRGAIGIIDPQNPEATEQAIKEQLSRAKDREKKEGKTSVQDSILVLRST